MIPRDVDMLEVTATLLGIFRTVLRDLLWIGAYLAVLAAAAALIDRIL